MPNVATQKLHLFIIHLFGGFCDVCIVSLKINELDDHPFHFPGRKSWVAGFRIGEKGQFYMYTQFPT